jgi:hypothetical protein
MNFIVAFHPLFFGNTQIHINWRVMIVSGQSSVSRLLLMEKGVIALADVLLSKTI